MTVDEMIAVLQGWKAGKAIEYRFSSLREWTSSCEEPVWNFATRQYRVKPEAREFWICGDLVVFTAHFSEWLFVRTTRHCDKCMHVREVIAQ